MLKKWRVLDSKPAFTNKWLSIRQETCEIHTGKIIDDYFVIEGSDVAIVVAVTTDKKVVLVREYKHGNREIMVQTAAGAINKGETPEQGARRELLEETGYTADTFVPVAKLARSPSNTPTYDYVFVALNAYAVEVNEAHADETENIEVHTVTLPQLRQMLRAGEIYDNGIVAAFYRVLDYLNLLGEVE